jgi:dephospho-CoA kinase
MIVLGLTGSIAMGKSTVTRMFADEGVPTTNADAIVHNLLAEDKAVIDEVRTHFPLAFDEGKIDRRKLGPLVFGNAEAMKKLEGILHPRVRAVEMAFVLRHQRGGEPVVVLDIPLLYETGADSRVDRVLVVTAPAEEQRARVLARPGMTEEKFHQILARQLPDAEKRSRAHYIIDTDKGMDHSRAEVKKILQELKRLDKPE